MLVAPGDGLAAWFTEPCGDLREDAPLRQQRGPHLCGVAGIASARAGLWLPARSACRPGSSPWAVSHPSGTALVPPWDSRPTGPASLALGGGGG